MKTALFPLLLLALSGLIGALTVPFQMNPLHWHAAGARDLIQRNATTGSDPLDLNIDPDIVNPVCGGVYLANINVESAPDPFYLSTACNTALNFIGGPKGSKDVDVVFTCPGQPTAGTGDRDVKVILAMQANTVLDGSKSGTQDIAANMEIISADNNFLLSVGVQIGAKVDASAGEIIFQYIFC